MWNTDDSVETYFWSWTRCCNRDDRCREWYTKDTTQFSEKRNRGFFWLVVRSNIIAPLRRMLEDTKSIQSNIAYRTGRQFPPGRGVRIGDDKNAAFYMSVEPHKRSELKTSYFEAGFHCRQSRCMSRNLRLVFTIDRVGVGVVIRSVELYDLLKTAFWFRWRSSENWLVGVACRSGKTKPIRTKRGNVHCDWFILPLLLPAPKIWFSLDRKRRSHKWSGTNSISTETDKKVILINFSPNEVK